ncbi:cytochrome c-type biogenesis protein [Rheinheimera texasensis]|uniref:cytochrome c-type biogenesis protein n=1 Tax=Rheinheimera texasensis TaxID=306205 RepID=UPI00068FC60B|nr:cytochrome c-type biogenesis protein [Rheinheimera texasensis]
MRLNGLLLSVLLLALPASATEDLLQFESAEQQQLYRQLTAELRCPKCQNQNIADSNAVVAVDMRNKTLELVRQGQSHDEVIDYMKQRYGDFVHYQPPVQLSTIWLWLLPLLAVLALGWTVFRRSDSSQTAVVGHADEQPDHSDLDAQLQAMIDEATAANRQQPKE